MFERRYSVLEVHLFTLKMLTGTRASPSSVAAAAPTILINQISHSSVLFSGCPNHEKWMHILIQGSHDIDHIIFLVHILVHFGSTKNKNVSQVQLFRYDDEEWTSLIAPDSGDWTREETDYLVQLADTFDLRFVVMADRYDVSVSFGQEVSHTHTSKDGSYKGQLSLVVRIFVDLLEYRKQ
jgi:hypothetical protein